MTSDIPFIDKRLAEAARYALMRRLLPAIRHNIAGSLQPVGMMAAMLERRMQAAAPDLVQLGKTSQSLNTLSREAVATVLRLMNWLAPRDSDLATVNSAVDEALAMMATELSFRGFSVVNQIANLQTSLPRSIVRGVFTASLMALTDQANGAAEVVVSAELTHDGELLLQISLEHGGTADLAGMEGRMQSYRVVEWDDVRALANEEDVGFSHDPNRVQLRYLLPANLN